jgi:hypothetical protein
MKVLNHVSTSQTLKIRGRFTNTDLVLNLRDEMTKEEFDITPTSVLYNDEFLEVAFSHPFDDVTSEYYEVVIERLGGALVWRGKVKINV